MELNFFPEAVIFDMDGVIINSEPCHEKGWKIALERHGAKLKKGWYDGWFGASDDYISEYFIKHYQINVPAKQLENEKRKDTIPILQREIETYPGVADKIKEIKQVKIGLATSSSREEVKIVLEKIGLSNAFHSIVASEDVTNKKPAPDSYLKSCKLLDIQPGKVIIMEDSDRGIEAGKRAGATVIAVKNTLEEEKLQKADYIFDDTVSAINSLLQLFTR